MEARLVCSNLAPDAILAFYWIEGSLATSGLARSLVQFVKLRKS